MFSVYDVLAFNGKRGVAYDRLGHSLWFTDQDVAPECLASLTTGKTVVLEAGVLYLATGRFTTIYSKEESTVTKKIAC